MQAIIGFEHFKIRCIVGCYPEERNELQELFVDVRVRYDISRCVKSQQLKDTADWSGLGQLCANLAQKQQYQLVESFASEALDLLLQQEGINWAWIRVKKPRGLPEAHYTYVELERTKT